MQKEILAILSFLCGETLTAVARPFLAKYSKSRKTCRKTFGNLVKSSTEDCKDLKSHSFNKWHFTVLSSL